MLNRRSLKILLWVGLGAALMVWSADLYDIVSKWFGLGGDEQEG